jgi:hypothetical protein
MIVLIKPILFAFLESDAVKRLILDLCKALAKRSSNEIDDQLCVVLERAMFNQKG